MVCSITKFASLSPGSFLWCLTFFPLKINPKAAHNTPKVFFFSTLAKKFVHGIDFFGLHVFQISRKRIANKVHPLSHSLLSYTHAKDFSEMGSTSSFGKYKNGHNRSLVIVKQEVGQRLVVFHTCEKFEGGIDFGLHVFLISRKRIA